MKKINQEKNQKLVVAAGLLAAGVLAVAGICFCLHKEEPVSYIAEGGEEPVETMQIETENEIPSTEPSVDSVEAELVISAETVPESRSEEPAQPLQKEPEKTEVEKPTEPPAEVMEPDNSNVQPENKEIPAQPAPQPETSSGTPQHGTVQDGKIYIDGFGWVDYNGGATEVIQGDGIYENGNKIGIMD